MKKLHLLVAVLMVVSLAGTGCKKKQAPPKGAPGMTGEMGAPHGEMGTPAAEKKVVVPDEVKGAWKAVKIEVEFKDQKEKKQFTIPVNSEFQVPGTGLTLKVGAFLPHFKMGPGEITSGSNSAENPAVQIEVLEGGKETFHGWLFSKFPAVHPYLHDKYALALVEGVKK